MIERVSHYPKQKLPASQKDDTWKRACVDFFIGSSYIGRYNGRTNSERKQINYELYNSRFNRKDLEYVTNPFGIDEDQSFPANLQNFNIIRPKIDLLVGEEIKRPFNWKVIQSNPEAISRLEEAQKGMLLQLLMAKVTGDQTNSKTPDGQPIETPEDVKKYMRYSFGDIYEQAASKILKYLNNKLDLPEEFTRGFKDALIAGEEVYYVGGRVDEPYVERCNPIFIDFDKDPELYNIEKGEWATRKLRMTPSNAYDRFRDILTDQDLEELLKGQYSTSTNANDVNYRFIRKEFQGDSFENLAANLINVFHVVWRSYKKIGYLMYQDENGQDQMTVVDESYKVSKGEEIEWDWIIEIWEGYRFGQNIYAGIRPTNYKQLPYIGTIYSRTNSNNVSLVDLMKPIQYMYIIIWYRLELALARDKGKIINIDITQIPKSLGIDFAKWAHYLSALGINLINPYEEGFDVARQGHAATFNQFGSVDLTVASVINEYVILLEKLETMIGELSGVSRQRQGAINNSELVGSVERAVIQSSLITEQIFWQHAQVKKRVMTALLNVATELWDGSEKKLHFILDDMSREFLTLPKDMAANEYDIFISDTAKDNRIIESLRSLAQSALQSGATLYDIAVMYMTDDVSDMKNKLKELDDRKNEIVQQQQQSQQQAQQQMAAMSDKVNAEKNRITEEDSIRKSQTAIEVAMIQAQSKIANDGDLDNDGTPDEMEIRKLDHERERDKDEINFKHKELEQQKREHEDNIKIKEKEVAVKKIAANKKPSTSSKK